jgi:hypothetical protein
MHDKVKLSRTIVLSQLNRDTCKVPFRKTFIASVARQSLIYISHIEDCFVARTPRNKALLQPKRLFNRLINGLSKLNHMRN